MIVITLSDCPPALRGDLTRWLQEISTGVYVGHVSARVRDELWERVRDRTKHGKATMVCSANNEQRMDFRVHNSDWQAVDFDGLKLMLRPNQECAKVTGELKSGFSNAAKMHRVRQVSNRKRIGNPPSERYVVVDVETTGLSAAEHEIIEIGAIIVNMKEVEAKFHALVKAKGRIPPSISTLTGLSNENLERDGKILATVMPDFLAFVQDLPVVSHNAEFDYQFLRSACEQCNLPLFSNPCIDTLALARRLLNDVKNYKLATLIEYFGIQASCIHRSTDDCLTTKQIYEKLIELQLAEV